MSYILHLSSIAVSLRILLADVWGPPRCLPLQSRTFLLPLHQVFTAFHFLECHSEFRTCVSCWIYLVLHQVFNAFHFLKISFRPCVSCQKYLRRLCWRNQRNSIPCQHSKFQLCKKELFYNLFILIS